MVFRLFTVSSFFYECEPIWLLVGMSHDIIDLLHMMYITVKHTEVLLSAVRFVTKWLHSAMLYLDMGFYQIPITNTKKVF